jgi:four helix bundle protein
VTPAELKERTTWFAVEVVKFCVQLRKQPEARHIADQLSDSATATAANYRSACRARSHREFVSKLGIALEEADESVGWLDIIIRAELTPDQKPASLIGEANQILAILAASRRTAQARGSRGARS